MKILSLILVLTGLMFGQTNSLLTLMSNDYQPPAGFEFFIDSNNKKVKTSEGEYFLVRKTSQYWASIYTFSFSLYAIGMGAVNETPLGYYDSASTVIIQATPNAGYSLSTWRNDLVGTQAIDTITIDSNKSITARFQKDIPNFRVIISDNAGQEAHAEAIKSAFIQGYESAGGTWSDSIQIQYNWSIENSFKSADTNGVDLIIRSYTGMVSYVSLANTYYPVTLFYPAGSNDYTQVYNSQGNLPSIVVTGAGDLANETGYDIEFYSPDPITTEPDLSSYSNGYIAGQLLFIADSLSVPLFVARQLAIEVGDILSDENGYGTVKIIDAINAYNPQTDYYTLDNYLGE